MYGVIFAREIPAQSLPESVELILSGMTQEWCLRTLNHQAC